MVEKKRITFVDIAKGIGILLVVLGHSFQPDDPIIFAVHMPLFFCLSGYLFSRGQSPANFISRKVKGLYVPFVFWNVFFVFVGAALGFYGLSFVSPRTYATVGRIFVLCDKSPFLGATWFLGGMFVVSILYMLLDRLLDRVACVRRRVLLAGVFAGLAAFSFAVKLPYAWNRPLVLSVFFGFGALMRALEGAYAGARFYRGGLVPLALAAFLPIALTQTAHQGPNEYSSPVLFVVAGLCGTYALVWLSHLLDDARAPFVARLTGALRYLGQHSLDIVIWHFVVFRFVVAAEILFAGEPLTVANVQAHYPIYSSEGARWIVYLALGATVPLAWCALLRKIHFVRQYHLA